MQRTHILVNNQKVSCLVSNIHADNVLVFLTPGPTTSEYMSNVDTIVGKDKGILIPDYPARGLSDKQENNSIPELARTLAAVIEKLEIKQVTIIAYSFGTNVAYELCKLIPNNIKEIHLVTPGEYFSDFQRIFVRFAFWLPIKIKALLPTYRKVLMKYKVLSHNYQTHNLDYLCKQVLGVLRYKFDDSKITMPCTLYIYDKDKLVTKSSEEKLKAAFINHKVISLKGGHPTKRADYNEFETKYLPGIN